MSTNSFRRRGGVDTWPGQDFEWGLTVLAYLRCQRLHIEWKKDGKSGIKSFSVANNVDGAGKLDDVVVRVEYVDNGEVRIKTIFVQCKHKSGFKDTKKEKTGFPSKWLGEKAIDEYAESFTQIQSIKNELAKNLKVSLNELKEFKSTPEDNLRCFLQGNNVDIEVLLYSNICLDKNYVLGKYKLQSHKIEPDISSTLFYTGGTELFEFRVEKNDSEKQENVSELFYEKFRSFVGQADELDTHVKKEIKLLSNSSVDVDSLRDQIFQEMKYHFKKSNPCQSLTEKDNLLTHISNFIELRNKGTNLIDNNLKNISVINIFSEEAINNISRLCNSKTGHINIVQSNFKEFEKLKFLQVLRKYHFEFTFLFVDEMSDIEKLKSARKSNSYRCLKNVYVLLTNIDFPVNIDQISNENLIQIVQNKQQQRTFSDFSKEFSKETEKYIINMNVCLQGARTDINSLCGEEWKKFLNEKTVYELLNRIVSEINSPLPTLDFYVARTFKKEILDPGYCFERTKTWNINNDCMILFSEGQNSIPGHDAAYKIFSNRREVTTFVEAIVDENKSEYSYHLCSRRNNQLQWIYSFGKTSSFTRSCTIEEDDFVNEINGKISILSDVAGMGKSTTLLSLARKYKENNPSHWVFFIELNKYLHLLKTNNDFSSKYAAIQFIGEKILNIKEMELNLFNHACEQSGNSALFFDAFDEISPDAEETFPMLLLALEKSRINTIVISSRPSYACKLEKTLFCKSIKFQGFTTMEKELALDGHWKHMLQNEGKIVEDNLLKITVKEIIELLQSGENFLSDVLEIPLQIRMIATIYYELLSNINDSGERVSLIFSLNLSALYGQFIRLHAERCCVEKNEMTFHNMKVDQKREFLNGKLRGAEELACQTIIPEALKNNEIDRTNEITTLCDVGIISNKSPVVFLHRTVAEYLAAKYIVKEIIYKCKKDDAKIVTLILVHPKYIIVRKFINSLIIETTIDVFGHLKDNRFIENELGRTPIHTSVIEGNIEILRLMAKNIILLNMKNRYGKTALYQACEYGVTEAATLLLNHKDCSVNICDYVGGTVLHVASEEGHTEIMQLILKRNSSLINMQNENGSTPLHNACWRNRPEAAKLLLFHKDCAVNICNNVGDTVLHVATRYGYTEIMQLILEHDSSLLNMQNKTGFTPLQKACWNGKTEAVKLLLSHRDCSVNICDKDGDTVFYVATWKGHIEIMHLILEHDSSLINLQNKAGFTPLHRACYNGRTGTEKLLLSHKDCSVNICDNDGDNVLHVASKYGYIEIMQLLLEQDGSLLNMQNKNGYTPLHITCWNGRTEAVKFLLSQIDCLVNERDFSSSRGLTALDVARKEGYTEIIELLLQNGVESN